VTGLGEPPVRTTIQAGSPSARARTLLGDTYAGFSYSTGPPKLPAKMRMGIRHARGPTSTSAAPSAAAASFFSAAATTCAGALHRVRLEGRAARPLPAPRPPPPPRPSSQVRLPSAGIPFIGLGLGASPGTAGLGLAHLAVQMATCGTSLNRASLWLIWSTKSRPWRRTACAASAPGARAADCNPWTTRVTHEAGCDAARFLRRARCPWSARGAAVAATPGAPGSCAARCGCRPR